MLVKGFFDLGGDFERKRVETLTEIANLLQKLVVENNGWNGGEKSGGGGDKGFGDARRDRAKAGGACIAETGEGVDDAPNGAEKADEGCDGAGGGEPGHALFDATNFVGGGELHADLHGVKAFELAGRMGIAGRKLALEFAKTGGVDGGEGRAGGRKGLRVGDTTGGAEDAEELVAFATDAAEETGFLQDHGPGNDGKNGEQKQNAAGNQSCLRQDAEEIGSEQRAKYKNSVYPSVKQKFCLTKKP